jgi:hypothetical protein
MMRRSKTPVRAAMALALAALVAGCGNAPDTGFGGKQVLALAGSLVKPGTRKATGPVVAMDIPAEALASWPEPLISAAVEDTRSAAVLGRIARNGANETYASHTGNHVTLRQGVVVATRGLGADLMSSAPPTRAALAAGQGSYSRSWQWLDGLDQTVSVTMTCTLAVSGQETVVFAGKAQATRVVAETCTGADGARVENRYWIDRAGILRKSRQWLGQDAGYLLLFDPNPRNFGS